MVIVTISPFDDVCESSKKITYPHNSMSNHFKQGKQILTLPGKVRTIPCQMLEQGTLTEGEGSVLLPPLYLLTSAPFYI
jgi:hypothetical protein